MALWRFGGLPLPDASLGAEIFKFGGGGFEGFSRTAGYRILANPGTKWAWHGAGLGQIELLPVWHPVSVCASSWRQVWHAKRKLESLWGTPTHSSHKVVYPLWQAFFQSKAEVGRSQLLIRHPRNLTLGPPDLRG